LFVEPTDTRPPSLLQGQFFSPSMIVGGVIFSFSTHLVAPVLISIVLSTFALVGVGASKPAVEPRDLRVIEARFVRLGEVFDPKKLPNRRVPRKSTAPDQKTAVSKTPRAVQPRPDAGVPPPNAAQDLITRLGDRAQMFAEIAEKREQEGNPNGVEFGTETEGRAGDIYRGQLVAFFQRGWTVPTVLSDDAIRSLTTSVIVQITQDLRVGDFRTINGSGEPLFDQSVTNRLQELKQSGTTIPEPPAEVASQFVGKEVRVDFKGKNANR
jgi:hypothetical protein